MSHAPQRRGAHQGDNPAPFVPELLLPREDVPHLPLPQRLDKRLLRLRHRHRRSLWGSHRVELRARADHLRVPQAADHQLPRLRLQRGHPHHHHHSRRQPRGRSGALQHSLQEPANASEASRPGAPPVHRRTQRKSQNGLSACTGGPRRVAQLLGLPVRCGGLSGVSSVQLQPLGLCYGRRRGPLTPTPAPTLHRTTTAIRRLPSHDSSREAGVPGFRALPHPHTCGVPRQPEAAATVAGARQGAGGLRARAYLHPLLLAPQRRPRPGCGRGGRQEEEGGGDQHGGVKEVHGVAGQ
mmetsp:Transcript_30873/g.68165  ORF Transcript_30873/g.68165 Transcript_30873/m.68165 type:complete len:296 (+) Transcript_30873:1536-2423(+)